jgi:hypothetical protein
MSSDSKEPSADQAAPFDWRAIIPPHPAAELFPLMAEAELKELAADIKANGVVDSIVIFHDRDDQKSLLDGRNRLDALALLGLLNIGNNYLRAVDVGGREMAVHHVFEKDDENPYALALSYNVHRRHLTAEQKRDLIAKVLKVTPGASNNSIAKQVKADDKTVAAVRRELEANSEIPNKPRVEASGRNARGRKTGSTPKPKAETPVLTVTGIKRRAKALGVRFSGRDDTFGFKVIFGDRAWGNLNLDGASARLDEIEREIQAKTGTITGNGDDKAKLDEPQPNGSGNSDPDSDGVEKMKQALGATKAETPTTTPIEANGEDEDDETEEQKFRLEHIHQTLRVLHYLLAIETWIPADINMVAMAMLVREEEDNLRRRRPIRARRRRASRTRAPGRPRTRRPPPPTAPRARAPAWRHSSSKPVAPASRSVSRSGLIVLSANPRRRRTRSCRPRR